MTSPSLDVEACVRLLKELLIYKKLVVGDITPQEETLIRDFASALPGMEKDRERLDAVAMLGLTVEPRGGKASGEWIAYRFPTSSAEEVLASRSPDPRAAIDRHIAARAAQPQETNCDICGKAGCDGTHMVDPYAHLLIRASSPSHRAAPPEGTSADAECRRSRRRRPCLGTNGRLCLLEPGHAGPHKPPPPEPDCGSDL